MVWGAAGIAVALAVAAGLADLRRSRRRDLDRIGYVDWRTLQLVAIVLAMVLAGVAFNGWPAAQ